MQCEHQSRSQRSRSFWSATGIVTSGRPLARSNTGSPQITDFPSLCACPESRLTNLIGSGLNLLCLQSHSKPECRWTLPGVPISSAWRKGPLGTSCVNTNSQASVSAAFSSVSVTRKKHKRRVPISFRNYYDEKQKQLDNFDHQNVKCKFSSLVQSLREQLVKPVSAPFFWVIF